MAVSIKTSIHAICQINTHGTRMVSVVADGKNLDDIVAQERKGSAWMKQTMIAALAMSVVSCLAAPAMAQQAETTPNAVKLFLTHCIKTLGNHAATNQSMAKAAGFAVTDTTGDERILVQNTKKSVDMSNLRLGAESVCFVGYTPTEQRDDAQTQAAAAVAKALNLPAESIQRKGKELRIKTSLGLIKIVANRVYPISIGVTSAYK